MPLPRAAFVRPDVKVGQDEELGLNGGRDRDRDGKRNGAKEKREEIGDRER
jgi:hypothetical protein